MQIETLHHADKQKTEGYILDLLAWLNYLVSRSKATANGGEAGIGSKAAANGVRAPTAIRSPPKEAGQQSVAEDASKSQI